MRRVSLPAALLALLLGCAAGNAVMITTRIIAMPSSLRASGALASGTCIAAVNHWPICVTAAGGVPAGTTRPNHTSTS